MIYEEILEEHPKKILIIDDVEKEVKSLKEALDEKKISYEYRQVNITQTNVNEKTIGGIEMVFLDLNYNPGIFGIVDHALCAEQVRLGVSEGQNYYLIGWTKDPDDLVDVVHELRKINLPPVAFTAMKKENYRTADEVYDVEKLFADVNNIFKKTESVIEFLGQVIQKEEDAVLINCILQQELGTFEVRRFDLLPFQDYIELKKGTFLKIRVTTKPGSRIFDFFYENNDLSHLFIKSDDFDDIDDISFLNR